MTHELKEPEPSKMGRPSKLTPEIQKMICDVLSAGNHYEPAYTLAGIDKTTFFRWMRLGKQQEDGDYSNFYHSVKKAVAQDEIVVVSQWRKGIPDNPAAAKDFLARRHPKRWGPREKHEITGNNGGPIETRHTIDLSKLTTEELQSLNVIFKRMRGDSEPARIGSNGEASRNGTSTPEP